MTLSPTYKFMMIAAEASGDVLGAGLITQLKTQAAGCDLIFCGVGGAKMASLGVQSPFDISQLSILGMMEGLKAYWKVKARVADTVDLFMKEKPDCVILIDSWGFTMRVAKAIRKIMPDVPLIKYVGPQVWATRPKRAKDLAQSVDLLLALHPMDAPYFEKEGLKTVVVGNPALNLNFEGADPVGLKKKLAIADDATIVIVLPGSRPSEVKRLMPSFIETMNALRQIYPELVFIMPVADTVKALVLNRIKDIKFDLHLIELEEDKLSAMKVATIALACSGTVTTELALAGCPMVIAYKVEPVTYFIFKNISPLNHVTLFNIMAGKAVAPEFIQHECTSQALVKALSERINNKDMLNKQIDEQFKALDLMGRGQRPPAEIAAYAVLDHLGLLSKMKPS